MCVRYIPGMLVGLVALSLGVAECCASPRVSRLVVDGRDISLAAISGGKEIDVGASSRTVSFHFSPDGSHSNLPVRFRYKLEGLDADWRETEPSMRLVVVFFDDNNEWVDETSFMIQGESQGWKGSMETAPMILRRESVAVPKRATRITVTLTSAGPPAAVGTVAVSALTVSKAGSVASVTPSILELVFPPRADSSQAVTVPAGWLQRGMRPSMAQVLRSEMAQGGAALAIVDNDESCHAEWQSPRIAADIKAGDLLQIEWRQSFSIGLAGVKHVTYDRLQAGQYRFRLKEVSPEGQVLDGEYALTMVVKPPVWQRSWFMVLCGVCFAGAVFGAARYMYWQRMRREIAHLKAQQALEEERTRIARDIHDDLGATLTHISMLSQQATPDNTSFFEMADNMVRINRAAREMTQAMDEIVWAVNPKHDRLDHLVTFFDSYAQEFLATAGIDFRSDYPAPVPQLAVAAPVRHNLFLAFKEAVANAARHSGCHRVDVAMTLVDGTVALSIADDGQGIVEQQGGRVGNGLSNMRRRLEGIGGRFSLESVPGRGTKVILEVHLVES